MIARDIIAHRGYWKTPSEKNTRDAILRAFDEGFSIETDFRDHAGTLVISHDPPTTDIEMSAEKFFDLFCQRASKEAYVAANIKADGLQVSLKLLVDKHGLDDAKLYAFDMSVPDMLGYLSRGIPTYSRLSEYEPVVAFNDKCAGVWVDNFTGDFEQVTAAAATLTKNLNVAFVSPELHGRPHEDVWHNIRSRGLHTNPKFAICTDFPADALRYFGN